jgi:hypothetical protein
VGARRHSWHSPQGKVRILQFNLVDHIKPLNILAALAINFHNARSGAAIQLDLGHGWRRVIHEGWRTFRKHPRYLMRTLTTRRKEVPAGTLARLHALGFMYPCRQRYRDALRRWQGCVPYRLTRTDGGSTHSRLVAVDLTVRVLERKRINLSPSATILFFCSATSLGISLPLRVIFDRSSQACRPVHVCFAPKAGLGLAATVGRRVEWARKPVSQAPKLERFDQALRTYPSPIGCRQASASG